jgi:hypothetical protein
MKEITVVAEQELVLTQAMLREAGLHGRVRLVIGEGEIRILPSAESRDLLVMTGHVSPLYERGARGDFAGILQANPPTPFYKGGAEAASVMPEEVC